MAHNVTFVGRQEQLQLLRSQENRNKSVFSAVYGRRRIGKTTLIEHALSSTRLLKFEGLEQADAQQQKGHFIGTLYRYSGQAAHRNLATNSSWSDLLIVLSEFIGREPTTLFFDEFQWMAAEEELLVSELKFVWDNYFARFNNIHLIVCGSVSSFIVKKVIRAKALYGRIDNIIDLQPLNLYQVYHDYFHTSSDNLNILDCYLALGGIPKYLEYLSPDQSLSQNISRLCMQREGILFREPERLFISHFGKVPHYRRIIEQLAAQPRLSASELAHKLDLSSGGRLSEYLENLDLSGFIEEYKPVSAPLKSKLCRYRIKDPFLRLYYHLIAPNAEVIEQESAPIAFSKLVDDAAFYSWQGLAFEQFCRENHRQLAEVLQFAAVKYQAGSWFTRAAGGSGFQIDLLYKRADQVLTVVEAKYATKVGLETKKAVEGKLARLKDLLAYKYIQKVLVSVYPVSKELQQSGYFDQIICFPELLSAGM